MLKYMVGEMYSRCLRGGRGSPKRTRKRRTMNEETAEQANELEQSHKLSPPRRVQMRTPWHLLLNESRKASLKPAQHLLDMPRSQSPPASEYSVWETHVAAT
jgi:hypothetical protein